LLGVENRHTLTGERPQPYHKTNGRPKEDGQSERNPEATGAHGQRKESASEEGQVDWDGRRGGFKQPRMGKNKLQPSCTRKKDPEINRGEKKHGGRDRNKKNRLLMSKKKQSRRGR